MKQIAYIFLISTFLTANTTKGTRTIAVTNFADSLVKQQHYFFALHEYKRLLFFNAVEEKALLFEKIAGCHFQMGDYVKARANLDSAYAYCISDSMKYALVFNKCLTYFKENAFGDALVNLNKLQTRENLYFHYKKNLYLGICYFGLENFGASYVCFKASLPPENILQLEQLNSLFQDIKKLKRPNPSLAIILSIIVPGSGQVYAGDFSDGLNSAALLSGLVYIGIFHPVVDYVIIAPFLYRYYMGGLLNARDAAINKQKNKQRIFYDQLMDIILHGHENNPR